MNQSTEHNNDAHDDGDDPRDVVLDALLREALGGNSPPDLKNQILDQLRSGDPSSAVTPPPIVQPVSHASDRSQTLTWLIAAATLAASIAIAVVLVKQNRNLDGALASPSDGVSTEQQIVQTIPPPGPATADPSANRGTDATPDPSSIAQDSSLQSDAQGDGAPTGRSGMTTDGSPTSKNARTLASGSEGTPGRASDGFGGGQLDLESFASQSRPTLPPASPATLVASRVENALVSYWDSMGVQPTDSISEEALVALLKDRLGIGLKVELVSDVDAVQRQLQSNANSRLIAQRFLQQLTSLRPDQINAPALRELRQAFENCFRGESKIDNLLSSLTTGQHPSSERWYSAMGQLGRHGMVQRMASVTMHQELRCLRCHDAKIDTRGSQSDYWAFAGMFQHGLKRGANSGGANNGGWQVAARTESPNSTAPGRSQQEVFYDALDGRRVMVSAGVPQRWLVPDGERTDSVDRIVPADLVQWGQTLRGSDRLAAGLINELWKMVHGRPLTSSVVDVDAAPHDASLDLLHQTLTEDLLVNEFDLSRSLALIIASPATRRSVPSSYSVEASGLWADAETENAFLAFAATKPFFKPLSVRDKLDTILATSGATLKVLQGGGTMLAQPVGNGNGGKTNTGQQKQDAQQRLRIRDFPVSNAESPVAWLSSIKDESSRLAHLCYLSGRNTVPDVVTEANAAMEQGGVEEPLRLHRVWWMIQP